MRTVNVYLPKVMTVKKFVESISSMEGDFDLIDGRYVVDARSLMGIFSLDRTKPIQLRIQKDSKNAMQAVERFIVAQPVDKPVDKPKDGKDELKNESVGKPKVAQPKMILEEV